MNKPVPHPLSKNRSDSPKLIFDKIILYFNHTSYGRQTRVIIIERTRSTITETTKFDLLLDIILHGPAGPFLWSSLTMFLCFTAMIYSIDKKDTGKGLIIIGGIFILIALVGFSDIVSAASFSIIPTLFIISGIATEWVNHKRHG